MLPTEEAAMEREEESTSGTALRVVVFGRAVGADVPLSPATESETESSVVSDTIPRYAMNSRREQEERTSRLASLRRSRYARPVPSCSARNA